MRETLPWKNTHMGLPGGNQAIRTPSSVQGLTRDPGELTPVLGLASDCSAQSDCRGCLEDSTRVNRPGELNWRRKRRSYPRVRGNGAASVTPIYLPNKWEETGSTRRLKNLAKVFGVAQPAALQMSAKEAPCANA